MPDNPSDGIDIDLDEDGQITRADVDAAAGRIGRKLDIGVVTGVIATFISLLALFVGWREAYLAQQSLRADTLPIIDVKAGYYLDLAEGVDTSEGFGYTVLMENVGTGTAHIVSITPSVGDETLDRDALLDQVASDDFLGSANIWHNDETGYLLAGDSALPFRLRWRNNLAIARIINDHYNENLERIEAVDVAVCYCSVFDTCYVARASDRQAPREVGECTSGNVQFDGFAETVEE